MARGRGPASTAAAAESSKSRSALDRALRDLEQPLRPCLDLRTFPSRTSSSGVRLLHYASLVRVVPSPDILSSLGSTQLVLQPQRSCLARNPQATLASDLVEDRPSTAASGCASAERCTGMLELVVSRVAQPPSLGKRRGRRYVAVQKCSSPPAATTSEFVCVVAPLSLIPSASRARPFDSTRGERPA